MIEILVMIFFGWPAIIAANSLAVAGILWRKTWLLVLAAALFTAPALYLSGYPSIRWFGILLPVLLLGAAYAVRKGRRVLAWILVAPTLIVSFGLALLVLGQ